MFYTDKPVSTSEEDILERKPFSEQLAKAVLLYNKQDNLTIGISGKWGCGKTSIINMVVNYIEANSQGFEKPIIIKFNPWNYSSSEQLISQFFQSIIIAVEREDKDSNLKDVGQALRDYSFLLEFASLVPVLKNYTGLIKGFSNNLGEIISKISKENSSIEKRKETITELLKKSSKKVLIIIDDIDRLNNEQIRLVFRLVNSLAGFPNMIYLLSYDKDVVVRALEKEQQYKGEEYLEKIIQANFEVPMSGNTKIYELFKKNIMLLIQDESKTDKQYFDLIFENCVVPFVDSIRDVNRIVNAFMLKYELIKDETNWIDMLAITTLQVCEHSIYSWIVDNISIISGGTEYGYKEIDREKEKLDYLDDFKQFNPKHPEIILRALQTLFPKLSYFTNEYYSDINNYELRRKNRIACPDKSKFYFSLSLNDAIISRNTIEKTINRYSRTELHEYMHYLVKTEKLNIYIVETMAFVDDIYKKRTTSWFFDEFIEMQEYIKENTKSIKHSSALLLECNEFCLELLRAIKSSKDRKTFLEYRIQNLDEKTIYFYLDIILSIVYSYDNIDKFENSWFDEEDYNEFQVNITAKLSQIYNSKNLFDSDKYEKIILLCKKLNNDNFTKTITESLKEPINTIKYLRFLMEQWGNRKEEGWYFDKNKFEYISIEEAETRTNKIVDNPNMFMSMSMELKETALAFKIWCSEAHNGFSKIVYINKKEVYSLLSKIEKAEGA